MRRVSPPEDAARAEAMRRAARFIVHYGPTCEARPPLAYASDGSPAQALPVRRAA